MQRTHKEGNLSRHYPCSECEHINLINEVEHLGLGWDIQHLKGELLIESLEQKSSILLRLAKIERSLLD